MRFRRQYTLYSDKAVKGTNLVLPCLSSRRWQKAGKEHRLHIKGKSTHLFEELLNNENLLRKVFESDLIIRVDSSNSLIQANTPESNANIPTFEEFAKPWWHWDTCPYVLARRAAGTESHPGINKSYVTCNELWTRKYLIPGMRYELTEELACAIGFDLIYRGNYFILVAIGENPPSRGR